MDELQTVIITIYYKKLFDRKVYANSLLACDDLPQEKWPYWIEKLGRKKRVVGTMVLRFTGRKFGE